MKSKFSFRQWAFSISVFLIFAVLPKPVNANHLAGAEITYTHLAGNMYRLHLALYRDCFGIAPPQSVIIHAEAVSCGIDTDYTLPVLAGVPPEITLPCAGSFTTCTGGTLPGYQRCGYELDIAIPAPCADWVFSFDIYNRSAGTTLANNSNLHVESRLNNSSSDNSSPQFTNDPLVFACSNEPFHYNNGMFDPDGDSLVYQLVNAIGAVYIGGYSGQQPLASVPPCSIDSFTGDFFMQPTAPQGGPIVFEIQDYRNGILMGSVLREIYTSVGFCGNHIPTETGMNGTSQQIAYVFPDDTICFDIFSDDVDAINVLTMTWNNTIPAAAFDTAGSPHPTGTFCWTPSLSDVRSQPYMFTSMIRDDNCPFNNAGVYSYFIYVTLDSSLVFLHEDDLVQVSAFLIFPNPSPGIFKIKSAEKFSEIRIYNQLGDCILQKEFEDRIDLSEQAAGIYFVRLIAAGGKTAIQKIARE